MFICLTVVVLFLSNDRLLLFISDISRRKSFIQLTDFPIYNKHFSNILDKTRTESVFCNSGLRFVKSGPSLVTFTNG